MTETDPYVIVSGGKRKRTKEELNVRGCDWGRVLNQVSGVALSGERNILHRSFATQGKVWLCMCHSWTANTCRTVILERARWTRPWLLRNTKSYLFCYFDLWVKYITFICYYYFLQERKQIMEKKNRKRPLLGTHTKSIALYKKKRRSGKKYRSIQSKVQLWMRHSLTILRVAL